MPFSINPSPDGRYIMIKVTGQTDRLMAREYHKASHALGKSLGLQCYLVDLTESRNTDTVLRHYTFATKDMADPGIDPDAHIALLVDPLDHSHDFLQIVLSDAGLDVKLFHDADLALLFLKKCFPDQ